MDVRHDIDHLEEPLDTSPANSAGDKPMSSYCASLRAKAAAHCKPEQPSGLYSQLEHTVCIILGFFLSRLVSLLRGIEIILSILNQFIKFIKAAFICRLSTPVTYGSVIVTGNSVDNRCLLAFSAFNGAEAVPAYF